MTELHVITHAGCAGHDPLPGHPERPARLRAAMAGIEQLDTFAVTEAVPVTRATLDRVHSPIYLDHLESIEHEIYADNEVRALDADTRVGPGSFDSARLAAGAACQAVEVAICESSAAFAVVRPPGHHAEPGAAMGFCIYNNIAAAAAHALERAGIERVAIVDFDVHHGNGTEAIFAGRSDVLFLSSHQVPLYPGTGAGPAGNPANVHNVGLPPGSGSNEFRTAWGGSLLETIDRFRPDLILVSAGFDAHWRDPLAQLDLKDEDFFWIGHELKNLAQSHSKSRIAASLEGGYDLKALTDSVLAFSEGLTCEH